jgi:hypothetical protein
VTLSGGNYAAGQGLILSGINGMTQLNGMKVFVNSPSGSTFELSSHPTNYMPIDTSGFGAYASGGQCSTLYTAGGFDDKQTAPNRPVDFCDGIAPAPYFSGGKFTNFAANWKNLGSRNASAAYDLATAYAASQNLSDLAALDNDFRAGRGGGVQNTLNFMRDNFLKAFDNLAGTYNIKVFQYEGGFEAFDPSVSVLHDIGFDRIVVADGYSAGVWTKADHGLKVGQALKLWTSGRLPGSFNQTDTYYVLSDNFSTNTFSLALNRGSQVQGGGGNAGNIGYGIKAGAMGDALLAWKNSYWGYNFQRDFYAYSTAYPHSVLPANLLVGGPNPWALYRFAIKQGAVPFQMYKAIQDFNNSR